MVTQINKLSEFKFVVDSNCIVHWLLVAQIAVLLTFFIVSYFTLKKRRFETLIAMFLGGLLVLLVTTTFFIGCDLCLGLLIADYVLWAIAFVVYLIGTIMLKKEEPQVVKQVVMVQQQVAEPVKEVAPAPVVTPVEEDEDGINYMYKFSFSARLIRSGKDRQEFYNEIKNDFLSYKKVNSNISWEHELFKLGRIKCGVMKVKGKTLCVYLPLDPDKYDQNRLFFQDMRVKGKEVEFPMMMKVKSDRGVKYVKELIADVMANNEIARLEEYTPVDYKLREMSIAQMLKSNPPLAKLIDGEPVSMKEKAKPVKVEPVKEVAPAPAPVAEESEEGIDYKYKFSFSARLIRAGKERQDFYNALKNEFLSYKKIDSNISWEHELFKLGRIKCGVMKVKGKTLCVYLPLDPDKYDQNRLFFQDMRVKGKEVEFPMMMKVKSDRGVKYVKELIADVMANNEIAKVEDYAMVDYRLPEMSITQMLKSNPPLAKLTDSAPVEFKK